MNIYIYNIMNIYIYIDGFSLTVRIIQIEGPYFQSNVREFQAAGNPESQWDCRGWYTMDGTAKSPVGYHWLLWNTMKFMG